jgi:MoxR-like ATPase
MANATTKTADAAKSTISNEIREKFVAIEKEMNRTHAERKDFVRGLLTATVAKQHILAIGPGGTGKSFLARELPKRFRKSATENSRYFEVALDETSTPDQVLGSPDIKAMVELGKTRRVATGMLPDADFAFLDEFFNANGPVLHSTMPLLNERLFHNNGQPVDVDLWTVIAGTNKLNADKDLAALWDRIHHRHEVHYVQDADALKRVIDGTIARKRGEDDREYTFVTLDELKTAHLEAMKLEAAPAVWKAFIDLRDELEHAGISVSTRRLGEGWAAVLASAWLNGHDRVKVGDLAVLRHMFWHNLEDQSKVKTIVLNACNPGESKALDLLSDLEKLKGEYKEALKLDKIKRNASAMETFKNCQKIVDEATPLLKQSEEAGADTGRLEELLESAEALKVQIGSEVFGFKPEQIASIQAR